MQWRGERTPFPIRLAMRMHRWTESNVCKSSMPNCRCSARGISKPPSNEMILLLLIHIELFLAQQLAPQVLVPTRRPSPPPGSCLTKAYHPPRSPALSSSKRVPQVEQAFTSSKRACFTVITAAVAFKATSLICLMQLWRSNNHRSTIRSQERSVVEDTQRRRAA